MTDGLDITVRIQPPDTVEVSVAQHYYIYFTCQCPSQVLPNPAFSFLLFHACLTPPPPPAPIQV